MPVRKTLLALILEVAERDGLDQSALAHCVGMTRPRASNLLHGHISRFNSETLIDILARLGVTIEVVVVKRQRYARWNLRKVRPGFRLPADYAPTTFTPLDADGGDASPVRRESS